MSIKRMDNVGFVVENLEVCIAFLEELGMELLGTGVVEGEWAARIVGLPEQKVDIAMLRTPDGDGQIELARYHHPQAVPGVPADAPANTLGIRRIMFKVDDLDDTVARLEAVGGELVGEISQYENLHRLCYLRGPEGIVFGLAEDLT